MRFFRHRLQTALAVFLLGAALFFLWYLLFFLPAKKAEPDGVLAGNERETAFLAETCRTSPGADAGGQAVEAFFLAGEKAVKL